MTIKNEEIQRVQLTDCNFTVQNMHNVSLCIFIHISNKLGCGMLLLLLSKVSSTLVLPKQKSGNSGCFSSSSFFYNIKYNIFFLYGGNLSLIAVLL